MYNKQLNAFVKTAESGSFTKAARELYLAPASLIQQINALEEHLGVILFERSSRGAKLTDAGSSLYHDALEIMRLSDAAVRKARIVQDGRGEVVRIGTNMLMKCRDLMGLCARLVDEMPDVTIELVSVPTPDNAGWSPLKGLGVEYDMVEGLYLSEFYRGKCGFLELGSTPLVAAFPAHHRLCGAESVALSDLAGDVVVMQQRGISKEFDELRDQMIAAGVESFVDVLHYSVQTFAQCEIAGQVLIAPALWADLYPDLHVSPIEGGSSIRYGIMHSRQLSKSARLLLSLAEQNVSAK
ncbi:MAG: LysR family transcriptional regulator [Eggerthellaceae bacterium]|nr:LysR family transcriptional regulator [Eggerthellaceae bacterium]